MHYFDQQKTKRFTFSWKTDINHNTNQRNQSRKPSVCCSSLFWIVQLPLFLQTHETHEEEEKHTNEFWNPVILYIINVFRLYCQYDDWTQLLHVCICYACYACYKVQVVAIGKWKTTNIKFTFRKYWLIDRSMDFKSGSLDRYKPCVIFCG